jgi:hypothetical protein
MLTGGADRGFRLPAGDWTHLFALRKALPMDSIWGSVRVAGIRGWFSIGTVHCGNKTITQELGRGAKRRKCQQRRRVHTVKRQQGFSTRLPLSRKGSHLIRIRPFKFIFAHLRKLVCQDLKYKKCKKRENKGGNKHSEPQIIMDPSIKHTLSQIITQCRKISGVSLLLFSHKKYAPLLPPMHFSAFFLV